MNRVKAGYSNVLARVAQNVAVIILCSKLLNQLFSFNFNTDDVEKYLMSAAEDNLENFRISQKGNVLIVNEKPYNYIATINGKSVRFLCLKDKSAEEKVTDE